MSNMNPDKLADILAIRREQERIGPFKEKEERLGRPYRPPELLELINRISDMEEGFEEKWGESYDDADREVFEREYAGEELAPVRAAEIDREMEGAGPVKVPTPEDGALKAGFWGGLVMGTLTWLGSRWLFGDNPALFVWFFGDNPDLWVWLFATTVWFFLIFGAAQGEVAPIGTRTTRTIPQDVKIAVSARDGRRCRICGSTRDLQYDHVIPFSIGGSSTDPRNIQLLCGRCNRRKSNR